MIVCAHNEEATLPAQLEALLGQDPATAWELIVVDNKSTDGTASIVENYAAQDSRVRLVRAQERPDKSYAMTVGVAHAVAPCLAFCDADDVVAPGWVAAISEGLRRHRVVTGPHELDLLNPRWLANSRGRSIENPVGSFAGIFPCIRGASWGIRRDLWEELGGMNDGFHPVEDIEFSLRVWLAGVQIAGLSDAVIHYRYRDTPAALWRQGFSYGRHRPRIARLLKESDKPTPPPFAGWRSWALLLLRLPTTVTRAGRATWIWIAGNRVGQIVGSVRERTLMI